MKKACVAYINFFENIIKQAIVDTNSDDWKEALTTAVVNGVMGRDINSDDITEWVKTLPDNMEDARCEFADADMDFVVTFI